MNLHFELIHQLTRREKQQQEPQISFIEQLVCKLFRT